MKPQFTILATALTALIASPVHALDARIKGSAHYGCTSEAYYDKTTDMVNQNDREAFTKVLAAGIASGICTMFKDGESVIIAKNGILTLTVRRPGDPAEYWVSGDAIAR